MARKSVFVLPRAYKEAFGQWNRSVGAYVVLNHGNVIHVTDMAIPSSLDILIKYKGKSVEKFIELLTYVLRKYYNGKEVARLPMHDKYVFKFAICLARMSNLQDISDVV